MQLEGIKHLIFDYGGTLDTNARHWAHVLWEGFRHAGIPVSEADFRDAYVFGERALARSPIIGPDDDFHVLLRKKTDIETRHLVETGRWTIGEARRRQAADSVADYCYAYARRTTGVSRRVLERLRPHYDMVLVTNFYGNIGAILRDFALPFFSHVVESSVVGVRKPDPAIFRMGVEATGGRPEEVLVIGDSYAKDIVPAKSIGCATVWLKGEGWTTETADGRAADFTITDLPELLNLLKHD